jgi:hypothetical protein
VRGLTAPLPQNNSGLAAGVKSPVSRRVRWVGSQPFTQQAACQPRWLAKLETRRTNNARNHYPAMSGLQKQELLNHEEQEDHDWPS